IKKHAGVSAAGRSRKGHSGAAIYVRGGIAGSRAARQYKRNVRTGDLRAAGNIKTSPIDNISAGIEVYNGLRFKLHAVAIDARVKGGASVRAVIILRTPRIAWCRQRTIGIG